MKKGLLRRLFVAVLALVTLSACSTDILDGLIPENDSKSIIRTENSTGAERLFDGDSCTEEFTSFPCEDVSTFPPTGEDVSWQASGDQYPVSVEIDLGRAYYGVDSYFFNGGEEGQESSALTVYAKRNLFDTWQLVGTVEAGEPGKWEALSFYDYMVAEAEFSRYVKLEFASEADFFNISEAYFTEQDEPGESIDCSNLPPDECPDEAPGRGAGLVP